MTDLDFMREAIAEAHRAAAQGEILVGAVVTHNGEIIGRSQNRVIRDTTCSRLHPRVIKLHCITQQETA